MSKENEALMSLSKEGTNMETQERIDDHDPERGYGPCKKCSHGARAHAPRSGLCMVEGCQCEIFDGPGFQPWEVAMSAPTLVRWYCPRCGIVRDTPGGIAPWCRHNALDLPGERMAPVKASHPYATGPLPWGDTDPSESESA